MMADSESSTNLPPGIDCPDILAFGTTGLVANYANTLRVVKVPHGGDPDAQDRWCKRVEDSSTARAGDKLAFF